MACALRFFRLAALVAVIGLVPHGSALGGDVLVVHEWGTFTSLQDEQGDELSGINTDDEPVPDFVHNLNQFVLSKPMLSRLHWMKGAPRMHPYVTMRLETPVIYFHPPKSWPAGKTADVFVEFRGGWLTQFYPKADASVPLEKNNPFDFGQLTPDTKSSLIWKGLRIGTNDVGPATDDHVWLAPRNVAAANVTVDGGESERYLFYRGVARNRAPLRAVLDRQQGEVALFANFDEVLTSDQSPRISAAWLVNVRADGKCAFRTLGGVTVSNEPAVRLTATSFRFGQGEFSDENRQRLEAAMHAALTVEGLFADEATALLSTWQRSYFASPGLRLFYIVPRQWTEHYLPLSLSCEAKIERVMVGRLELISDEQRKLLDKMARATISDGKWVERIPNSPARDRFIAGRSDFGNLGVPIPADYQMYLDLARFRNALVVHEERVRPSPSITQFINTYQLHPFRVRQ
jgi:hypothetical protein